MSVFDIESLLMREAEDLLSHVEDDLRRGAFEMEYRIIQFPVKIIGEYEIVLYPQCGGFLTPILYKAGTRKAVWECLPQETEEKAFAVAQEWIDQQ